MRLPLLGFLLCLSCAPTLSGQLHGEGDRVFSSEARVNITELSAPSGQSAPAKVLLLPVTRDGRFATDEALPPGDYLLEALVPGYMPQSQKINLTQTTHADLTLQARKAAPVHATHLNSGLEEGRGAGGATLTPPSL